MQPESTSPEHVSHASQAAEACPSQPLTKKSKTLSAIMLAIITVAGIALLIWFDLDEIGAFMHANASWVVLISQVIFVALGFTIIPATPICLILAAVMGPWKAIFWGTVGMTLSALVEYFVARQFHDAFDVDRWRAKLPPRWRNLPLDSVLVLIFGRFFPGPKVIAFCAVSTRTPMLKYIWTAFVSNLLGMAIVILPFVGILKLPWA